MLHQSAQPEKSVLQQAIESGWWDYVENLLRKHDYREKYDLTDVETLTTNPQLNDSTKQTAYLYLLAHAPIDKLKTLLNQIDFGFTDINVANATLVVVANGRHDVLAWLEENQKLHLEAEDVSGCGAVLCAIKNGQIAMLETLLKSTTAGGFGLNLQVKNRYEIGPVQMAILSGQLAMLKKLLQPKSEGGYGLRLDAKRTKHKKLKKIKPLVLFAILSGNFDMLDALLKSKSEGGFELSLNVKDSHGIDPVLMAVANGLIEMLDALLQPKEIGGYGLSLNVKCNDGTGPVIMAITNRQLVMLKKLLRPIQEGGYGLPVDSIETCLKNIDGDKDGDKDIFAWLVRYHFNKLRVTDAAAVFDWLATLPANYGDRFSKKWLNELLMECYQVLVASHISMRKLPAHFKLLIKKLEALSKGAARILLADSYLCDKSFVAAYENYLSVFTDSDCLESRRSHAGYQLANMIFTGDVILKEDGLLDEAQTELRKSVTSTQRDTEGKNLDVMRRRALSAYEYLHGDSSVEASQLRKRFDSALGGGIKLDSEAGIWPLDVTRQYFEYYSDKDPKLLRENSFKQSFRQMHVLAGTKKAAPETEISAFAGHAPFFTAMKKGEEDAASKASKSEPKNEKWQPQ